MATGKGGRFILLLAGQTWRNPDEALPLCFGMEADVPGLRIRRQVTATLSRKRTARRTRMKWCQERGQLPEPASRHSKNPIFAWDFLACNVLTTCAWLRLRYGVRRGWRT
ncbi:hypothetical protein SAMN02787142_0608 [Burkholderia sp. WP9]|nr:hypothetical protein SAMN02787142_0608 [Burkholderia sp. WP9]